jgi:hypothetical protein
MIRLRYNGSIIDDPAYMALHPSVSFTAPLSQAEVDQFGDADVLIPSPPPALTAGQTYALTAAQDESGAWVEVWTVTAAPELTLAQKQAKLLSAFSFYEHSQIFGSGIGLLTLGVLQQKPRCLAVQMYLKTLWEDYQARLTALNNGQNVSFDFSNNGDKPFSVADLMEDLGL